VSFLAFTLFDVVSFMIECQIAVAFALMYFRCHRVLMVIGRKPLVLNWLVGGILGGMSYFTIDYNSSSGMCIMSNQSTHPAVAVFVGLSFVISMVAYLASTLSAGCDHSSPDSVAHRIRIRSLVYPLNFFICYGSALVINVNPSFFYSPEHIRTSRIVAYTAAYSNGFVNAMTYAWILRGPQKLLQRNKLVDSTEKHDPLGCASFHVQFADYSCHVYDPNSNLEHHNSNLEHSHDSANSTPSKASLIHGCDSQDDEFLRACLKHACEARTVHNKPPDASLHAGYDPPLPDNEFYGA
jgi:hypothetical protein